MLPIHRKALLYQDLGLIVVRQRRQLIDLEVFRMTCVADCLVQPAVQQ